MVERLPVKEKVVGSSPTCGANSTDFFGSFDSSSGVDYGSFY